MTEAKKKIVGMEAILNSTFTDLSDDFDLPVPAGGEATYVMQLVRYNILDDKEDPPRTFVEVYWKAVDTVDVDLPEGKDIRDSYPVRDKWWLHTNGARKYTSGLLRRNWGIDVGPKTFIKDAIQQALGHTAQVTVVQNVADNGNVYTNVERVVPHAQESAEDEV